MFGKYLKFYIENKKNRLETIIKKKFSEKKLELNY